MVIAYASRPARDLKRKIKPALTAARARHRTLAGSQLRKTERRDGETGATAIMMERKREKDAEDEIRGCCSR